MPKKKIEAAMIGVNRELIDVIDNFITHGYKLTPEAQNAVAHFIHHLADMPSNMQSLPVSGEELIEFLKGAKSENG